MILILHDNSDLFQPTQPLINQAAIISKQPTRGQTALSPFQGTRQ